MSVFLCIMQTTNPFIWTQPSNWLCIFTELVVFQHEDLYAVRSRYPQQKINTADQNFHNTQKAFRWHQKRLFLPLRVTFLIQRSPKARHCKKKSGFLTRLCGISYASMVTIDWTPKHRQAQKLRSNIGWGHRSARNNHEEGGFNFFLYPTNSRLSNRYLLPHSFILPQSFGNQYGQYEWWIGLNEEADRCWYTRPVLQPPFFHYHKNSRHRINDLRSI